MQGCLEDATTWIVPMKKAALVGPPLRSAAAALASGEGESERQGADAQGRGETERPLDEGHGTFLLFVEGRLAADLLRNCNIGS